MNSTTIYPSRFHAITTITKWHATTCMFCGNSIHASSRHYHVADAGPMCIDCIERTTVHLRGAESYIRLTQLHPPSPA